MRKQIVKIQENVYLFEKIKESRDQIQDLNSMIYEDPNDKDTVQFARDEIQMQDQQLQKYADTALELLLEQEEFDDCDTITVEIRPGVGGSESSLFTYDVMQMFKAYFNSKGWSWQITKFTEDESSAKGCKLGIFQVKGEQVYQRMKCESGIHKVIRVPETEKAGRLHSSAIAVIVMPEIPFDYQVDEKDLQITFMRSSGAGGQHVNKTDSACRIKHIPSGLQVHIQDSRTQEKNKQDALRIIKEKLYKIEVEKKVQAITERRNQQVQGTDRSDKIRTYNFPQSRITDHRTNLTLFGIDKMMEGQLLDQFIQEYLDLQNKIKLEILIKELTKQN